PRNAVATPQQLLGRAGHDLGDHAAEEAARLQLDVGVRRDLVLALDLQLDLDAPGTDAEVLHASDVDPSQLDGITLPYATRVVERGRYHVAAPEHGCVGQGEERQQRRGDTGDHEDADPELAVAAAQGLRGWKGFAHGSSII